MQNMRVAQTVHLIVRQQNTGELGEVDLTVQVSTIFGEEFLTDLSERLRALLVLQMAGGALQHSRISQPRFVEVSNDE